MIVALALLIAGAGDPRIPLAELQLQERHQEALVRVETELLERPQTATDLGFHYLRGHLLEELGRRDEALPAFRDAMLAQPQLAAYSLYRLAENQFRLRHPETAAGLLVRLLESDPPLPLLRPATDLLISAIEAGGDCGLLARMNSWNLTGGIFRSMRLANADCLQMRGRTREARSILIDLLENDVSDEPGRGAAERLNRLLRATPDSTAPIRTLGMAFYHHRLFDLSIRYLTLSLGNPTTWPSALSTEDDFRTVYALARSNFWSRNYIQAASQFGQLAAVIDDVEEKGKSLYQQGRCYELLGNWDSAADSFRRAYLAAPEGRWADAGLMSAMRVEWRTGSAESALQLYELLGSRRSWHSMFTRATLFLTASDLVRGRTDRARSWLSRISKNRDESSIEVAYWSARLAEFDNLSQAVEHYIRALVEDAYHPLSRAALVRLKSPALAAAAEARAKNLANSSRGTDLLASWLILGDREPGPAARAKLERSLSADPTVRPFMSFEAREPQDWPIWDARLTQPEELLLALGVWDQGSSVVLKHFPVTQPNLAYTGGKILSLAKQARTSIYVGEILSKRIPSRMPRALIPRELQELLYPVPYRDLVRKESNRWGIDPLLLLALMREESRFDPMAVSGASARGLAQFVLPTAERIARKVGIERLAARDLHTPSVSIALGAAYISELTEEFGNGAHSVLAAYNAGEDQTRVWRSYCYSKEPAEFFSKVGFTETRNYLRKVLTSRAHYAELYDTGASLTLSPRPAQSAENN